MPKRPIIGISSGDPNGIGPEVVLKSFQNEQVLKESSLVVFGNKSLYEFYSKTLNISLPAHESIDSMKAIQKSGLYFFEHESLEFNAKPGELSSEAGKIAFNSLELCVDQALAGNIDAILTPPINKSNIQSAHFQFPGHTEYLAHKSACSEALMFMVYQGFRVAMVSGHVALKDVSKNITEDKIIARCQAVNRSLIKDFGLGNPRIAVLSLNPHAGDLGLLGTEEQEIIGPSIERLKQEGIQCEGPFPSDGFFGSSKQDEYDAVVAMYHDQALIPFKAISFDKGVNFTAELPIIRSSPDHGTAMDIAGKALASSKSFEAALRLAIDVYHKRSRSQDIKA